MFLSAVSMLVVAQSSSEIPERLMNNPVYTHTHTHTHTHIFMCLNKCSKTYTHMKLLLKKDNTINES